MYSVAESSNLSSMLTINVEIVRRYMWAVWAQSAHSTRMVEDMEIARPILESAYCSFLSRLVITEGRFQFRILTQYLMVHILTSSKTAS